MAKRRRGFDRRQPAAPTSGRRPAPPGSGRPASRAAGDAAAAAAKKRRDRVIFATVGAGVGLVLFSVIGGLGAPQPTPSPSAPAPTASVLPSPSATAAATLAPSPTIGGSAPVISGIACDVDEQTTYHVHSHLNIRIDGQLELPPANVGILPTCLYWLHTHLGQGVIHVEAPSEGRFTLGQFFDVWNKPLSATQVADHTVGPGQSLFVFVDRVPYQGDPRAIELGNLVAIELQVGPAALEPLPYTFPAELQ